MAIGQRFVLPNQFAVDATGVPYAGGLLFFYASGTSTPLSTFQDPGLTTANQNPVEADSAGRFGNVFLQTLPYKVVLEDSLGNQIWSLDPVSSANPADIQTVASMAALRTNQTGAQIGTIWLNSFHGGASPDGGEGAFTWNSASTAADNQGTVIQVTGLSTGRWLRQTGGGLYSVRWFGALGDDATDDTAGVQACFNAASAAAAGVYGPGGNYIVSNLLYGANTVGAQSVAPYALVGDGFNTNFIAKAGTTGTLIKATNIAGQRWSDIRIDTSATPEVVGLDTSWNAFVGPSLGGAYTRINLLCNNSTQCWLATNNNDVTFDEPTCVNTGSGAALSILAGGGSIYVTNPRLSSTLIISGQQWEISGGGVVIGLDIAPDAFNTGFVHGTQLWASPKLGDAFGVQCAVRNRSAGRPNLSFIGNLFSQGGAVGGWVAFGQGTDAGRTYGGITMDGCNFSVTPGNNSSILGQSMTGPFGSNSRGVVIARNTNFGVMSAAGNPNNQWVVDGSQGCSNSSGSFGGELLAPAYSNSWAGGVAIGAIPALQIVRNGSNVHLTGAAGGGTTTDGTVVFTLPLGFRPAEPTSLSCVGFTAGNIQKPFLALVTTTATGGGAVTINGVSAAGITALVFDNVFVSAPQ